MRSQTEARQDARNHLAQATDALQDADADTNLIELIEETHSAIGNESKTVVKAVSYQ